MNSSTRSPNLAQLSEMHEHAARSRCYLTTTSKAGRGHPDDHASHHRGWSGLAEAERFEPPVPSGTLAFKVRDSPTSGDRRSAIRDSKNPTGPVLPVPDMPAFLREIKQGRFDPR